MSEEENEEPKPDTGTAPLFELDEEQEQETNVVDESTAQNETGSAANPHQGYTQPKGEHGVS